MNKDIERKLYFSNVKTKYCLNCGAKMLEEI